jgi:hypothetical protein
METDQRHSLGRQFERTADHHKLNGHCNVENRKPPSWLIGLKTKVHYWLHQEGKPSPMITFHRGIESLGLRDPSVSKVRMYQTIGSFDDQPALFVEGHAPHLSIWRRLQR